MTSHEVVAAHRAAGRTFDAAGVRSFVREEGDGAPVVCIHGVPTSSFLWRKVLAELGRRALRGVAFDLPGLGLAARPTDYDYTWSGLGRFCVAAVDALGLDRFHLVVHDIGGPIGFVRDAPYPIQILWGADDPALPLAHHGEQVRRAVGTDDVYTVPAKHFLQEDQAPTVAERIATLAETT